MIEGVVKVYCDGEVVARVKCGSGGRMAIFGSWNGRRVAVGTRVTPRPRTDPGERNHRTGLLP